MNKVCVFSAPGGLRGAPGVCAQGGGAARGPHRGVPQCCSLWVFCGPPLLAKKRNISGSKMARFCVCGATWGCVASLVCAHKGLPARGS